MALYLSLCQLFGRPGQHPSERVALAHADEWSAPVQSLWSGPSDPAPNRSILSRSSIERTALRHGCWNAFDVVISSFVGLAVCRYSVRRR